MIVTKAEQLLALTRDRRKSLKLESRSLAGVAGVSKKFLSQLENLKVSVELDSLIKVTHSLGLLIPVLDDPNTMAMVIKTRRKELQLEQAVAASLCNVSPRFLSSLENGKPKKRLNKVFDVLNALAIEVEVISK
ncbi:MAG: hypothetical protein CMQ17_10450 [Gammaproteobacteria bacterium]|nr:hypothetical protein [Gammaproteobacteria bacterium]